MVCWQINLVTVEFKMENLDILRETAERLGWSFSYNENNNTAFVGGMPLDLAKQKAEISQYEESKMKNLKIAYSETVLVRASKKNRWALTKDKKKQKKNAFVMRRY